MDLRLRAKTRYRATAWAVCNACTTRMLAGRLEAGRALLCPERRVVWADGFDNLVTTIGLNLLFDNSFYAVPAAVTWYVGLKGTGSVVAGDTMASHAGWAEYTTYSAGARPAFTPNGATAAGAMSNSNSLASFAASGSGTVYGAFMVNDATKGGTSGQLYGAGDFSTPKNLVTGQILTVEIDLAVTSN